MLSLICTKVLVPDSGEGRKLFLFPYICITFNIQISTSAYNILWQNKYIQLITYLYNEIINNFTNLYVQNIY